MISSIPELHRTDSFLTQMDLDHLLSICEKRADMRVHREANQNNQVCVTLNLPDQPRLNGATIFTAIHRDGRWWEASSDRRFVP